MSSLVRLQGITKKFPLMEYAALNDIHLSIDDCESLAIMGPSGSGKTTLLNILGLLDNPTDGRYFLHNQDVNSLSQLEKARIRNLSFGFIFQSHLLVPHYTLLDNCCLPLLYRKTNYQLAKKTALQWLDRLGLGGLERRYPHQVSGGQQQRAAIARAVVGNPLMLLADEPTSALDEHTKNDVLNILLSLHKENKISLVIVTHDPFVASKCDRVINLSAMVQDARVLA